jgi:capsular polysaccharide transport system permease protein
MVFRVSTDASSPILGGIARPLATAGSRLRGLPPLFVWLVLIPGLVAAFYYLVLASPIYVSQAQFIVRAPTAPQSPGGGLGSLFQGVGLGPAETDSFAVHDYVMSRDAIGELDRDHHLRAALAPPGADFLSRFPRPFEPTSFENLAKAYPRFVTVDYNSSTGISTLTVRSFRPEDAKEIASALLDGGEAVVNRLNTRADQDAIAETRTEIGEGETELARAEQNLTEFRNRERLIDPTRSSAVNLDLLGKLEGDVATLRAERSGIAASAPQSPELPSLDSRIRAYQQQADDERTNMAGQTGSLAPMIGEYERLTLERDLADKSLATAAAASEEARLEARRKRLYLERIVNPNLPDAATEPHRWQSLLTILMSLLLAYGVITLLIAGFREHRQA